MALKIETNNSATAYHVVHGATLFPYAIDAQMAVAQHPLEWSDVPWTKEAESASRAELDKKLKAEGQPPLPAPVPLTPEDQKALDEHNKAVAEAAKRLDDYRKKKAEEQKIADQAAADEVLVATPPPKPDPNVRKPLTPAQTRKFAATLTPAEQAEVDRKAGGFNQPGAPTPGLQQTEAQRLAAEKTEADRQAAAVRGGATFT